jgi:small-conductance mechanosensitive channel
MSTYNNVNLSREFAMARFAEPHLASPSHDARNSSPLLIGDMGSALDGSRTLAGMLLAAAMAALLVVADQVIDTWSDGHLLAGWVALWTVAFAALAVLATPLRQLSALAARGFFRRMAAARAAQTEARMWEMASHDPRVLEEIRAAVARHAD